MTNELNGPNLILGKFTIEDISQACDAFQGVELDLFDYLSLSPIKRKRLDRFCTKIRKAIFKVHLLKNRSEEEYRDALLIIQNEFTACAIEIIISSGRRCWDTHTITQSQEAFFLSLKEFCFSAKIELGIQDNLKSIRNVLSRAPTLGVVLDLDYHSKLMRGITLPSHYKLHGWNEERWVRRYGELRARSLLSALKSKKGDLILSHSGRVDEGPLFKKWLKHVSI